MLKSYTIFSLLFVVSIAFNVYLLIYNKQYINDNLFYPFITIFLGVIFIFTSYGHKFKYKYFFVVKTILVIFIYSALLLFINPIENGTYIDSGNYKIFDSFREIRKNDKIDVLVLSNKDDSLFSGLILVDWKSYDLRDFPSSIIVNYKKFGPFSFDNSFMIRNGEIIELQVRPSEIIDRSSAIVEEIESQTLN